MRAGAAEFLRAGVHRVHKSRHRAGDVLAEDVAGLVGGDQHRAVQQILHGHRFAGLDLWIGVGAVSLDVIEAVLRCDDGVAQADVSALHGLDHHQSRHEFGGAGRLDPLVGILFKVDLAGVFIHDDRRPGVDLRLRHRQRGHGQERHGQQHDKQQGKKLEFFHVILRESMV